MKITKINYKGISLIETVVYLALFAVVFTVIVSFFITVSNANKGAKDKQQLEYVSLFVIKHLEQNLQSETISSVTTDSIVFTGNGVSNNYVFSDRIQFNNGIQIIPVTPLFVSISNTILTSVKDKNNNIVGVEIDFRVNSISDTSLHREVHLTILQSNL